MLGLEGLVLKMPVPGGLTTEELIQVRARVRLPIPHHYRYPVQPIQRRHEYYGNKGGGSGQGPGNKQWYLYC